MIIIAPGAIRFAGNAPKPGNAHYLLTVRFRKSRRAEFEALRDAVLASPR